MNFICTSCRIPSGEYAKRCTTCGSEYSLTPLQVGRRTRTTTSIGRLPWLATALFFGALLVAILLRPSPNDAESAVYLPNSSTDSSAANTPKDVEQELIEATEKAWQQYTDGSDTLWNFGLKGNYRIWVEEGSDCQVIELENSEDAQKTASTYGNYFMGTATTVSLISARNMAVLDRSFEESCTRALKEYYGR